MAKETTSPNQACGENDTAWVAVHKNTRKHIVEYTGAEKQTAEKVRFRHLSFFFSLIPTLD